MLSDREVIHRFVRDGYISKEDSPTTRRVTFNDYTDYLYKDGLITGEQYDNLCIPDSLEECDDPVDWLAARTKPDPSFPMV